MRKMVLRPEVRRAIHLSAYVMAALVFCATTAVADEAFEPQIGGIGFTLTGYSDDPSLGAQFLCEEEDIPRGIHAIPYHNSGLENLSFVGSDRCVLDPGTFGLFADLELQATYNGSPQQVKLYQVNTLTGGIDGSSVLAQTVDFFQEVGSPYVMNYGVSHASIPITDQAYVYVSSSQETWMSDLLSSGNYANITFGDLVLPGAHDAGMYKIGDLTNITLYVHLYCQLPVLDQLCSTVSGLIGAQAVQNLALTQKDVTLNQLNMGVRFFDFRPATVIGSGSPSASNTFHVHNFVPGVEFQYFLEHVNTFLTANPREVVVVQITSSGVDETYYTPLTQSQIVDFVRSTISTDVGFNVVSSLSEYSDRTLQSIVAAGQRVLIVFDPADVNDSYSGSAYSESLTDPSYVLGALNTALTNCPLTSHQYNVFQLQNTASGALGNSKTIILQHLPSWANNLLASGTGNLLQATKPIFDKATYNWLAEGTTATAIAGCQGPIMLLNDFVEVSLVTHAVGLSKYRHTGIE